MEILANVGSEFFSARIAPPSVESNVPLNSWLYGPFQKRYFSTPVACGLEIRLDGSSAMKGKKGRACLLAIGSRREKRISMYDKWDFEIRPRRPRPHGILTIWSYVRRLIVL